MPKAAFGPVWASAKCLCGIDDRVSGLTTSLNTQFGKGPDISEFMKDLFMPHGMSLVREAGASWELSFAGSQTSLYTF